MPHSHEITELLRAWSHGDSEALEKLAPLVDAELRTIAHAYMNQERSGHLLQTTALVNEAYVRFIEAKNPTWQDRKHFYALVARRMHQILIDHARRQLAKKGGQRPNHVALDEIAELSVEKSAELVLLDEALTKLESIDRRKARLIEYRFFGGFSLEEAADLLEVSESTIEREWRTARSWLKREIG